MADKSPYRTRCDYCGEHVGYDKPWVLLNRYGVGTGSKRCLSEIVTDGEYLWEVDEDTGDVEAGGALLCWPQCLHSWIEGKMIQVDAEAP